MNTKLLSIVTASAMFAAVDAMAVTAEEISGVYNANITVLDLGAFGNAGEDWTPVTFDQHEVTVTAEDNTLTFINFFPVENGNLTGTFDPENATILFQPQTVLGDYTFCGYPTGDWWMDNKLTEDPAPMTAKVNEDAQIVFDMWAIVKGTDVVATNFYSNILTPVQTGTLTAEKLAGTYNANPFMVLDLEPFGSETSDWNIVDLSNHDVTVTADGNTLTFTNLFPFDGGNLTGTFNAENSTISFEPQTVMNLYTFCAYPTGDWWMDNKLTEDPAPMTAKVNEDAQIVFDMWAIVKGTDVVATNYTADILVPVNTDAGVSDISFIPSDKVYVYTVTGLYVGSADTVRNALENLPVGLYIVNGKKILKK
ncbi:MAG: hypothetical protein K2H47_06845 [Muribaculaceae bacterium]|nr:hypothetical protein [Muribaculaceae bacterium]